VTSVHEHDLSILPHALRLVGGSHPIDAGFLARDARAWLASPRQGLTSAIDSVAGADEIVSALRRIAPSDVTVAACAASEHSCWAELDRRPAGEGAETCLLGLSCGADGTVWRLVLLRAERVPAWPGDPAVLAPDARPAIDRYFGELMRSSFRGAARQFAGDVIYSHPPYRSGAARVLYLGRDALLRGFAGERGPTPARQVITGFWQRRDRLFIEGVVEGIPNGGTFVSAGQITAEGEIARYVAFYSTQRFSGRPS
jgi:hypothetical protein